MCHSSLCLYSIPAFSLVTNYCGHSSYKATTEIDHRANHVDVVSSSLNQVLVCCTSDLIFVSCSYCVHMNNTHG